MSNLQISIANIQNNKTLYMGFNSNFKTNQTYNIYIDICKVDVDREILRYL